MNNEVSNVIANLRAVNILLLLMHMECYTFPLDSSLGSLLRVFRFRLIGMLDVVCDLTKFDTIRDELLSAIDDIECRKSDSFYTREYLDMLLSLFLDSRDCVYMNYENALELKQTIANLLTKKVTELLASILWTRVAFFSCYPDERLASLSNGWKSFCMQLSECAKDQNSMDARSLAIFSLSQWRQSEIVSEALAEQDRSLPHREGLMRAAAEVDEAIASLQPAM